jgi:hypothetical protein
VRHFQRDGFEAIISKRALPISAIQYLAASELVGGFFHGHHPKKNFATSLKRTIPVSRACGNVPVASISAPRTGDAVNGVDSALALQCDLIACPNEEHQ